MCLVRKAALSEFHFVVGDDTRPDDSNLNVHVLSPIMCVYFDALVEYSLCSSDSDLIEKVEIKEDGYPVNWRDRLAAVLKEHKSQSAFAEL